MPYLDLLFAYTEKEHRFNETQTQVLINAIDKCKILDPACGSGAFPMGVLHKMVHILHKLDPNNEQWKQRQIDKVNKLIEEAQGITDTATRERVIAGLEHNKSDIEDAFGSNELDYGRKLYLIENCIYGVDIQPVAVQIAKLRFFISLVIDQKKQAGKENFGIRALPNLETKFVAANTLIGLDKPKQLSLIKDAIIVELEKELLDLRHRYFSARTRKDKMRYQNQDRSIREQIAERLKINGWHAETARQIVAFDPYDQNASSPFFDQEWMFGITPSPAGEGRGEGGVFDVVIGNPPYGASYSSSGKKYFLQNYDSTKSIPGIQKGSLDTFTLFIEHGYKSIENNGNLCFIVPISITSSDSMTALHNLLEQNCETIKVSSYAVRPQPVFENSVVNTSILFFTRTNTRCKHLLATKMYRKNQEIDLQKLVDNLEFTDVLDVKIRGRYPKISYAIEKDILLKIFKQEKTIGEMITEKGREIFYRTTGGRYFKVITNYATGSTQEKSICIEKKYANAVGTILSSNLFFWFYQIYSDNLHIKSYEIESFRIPCGKLSNEIIADIEQLYIEYLKDIERNANIRQTTRYANIDSFKEYKIGKSKLIIDRIDDLICPLYGLTDKEIEFIKNYEIEYRLSNEADG